MKKRSAYFITKNLYVRKHYVVTQPTRPSDLANYDYEDDDQGSGWRAKARRLQARRWRKLKHQVF